MSRARRWLLWTGLAVIAALLAFPLRETIYDAVVIPVAYLGWGLGLLYRSVSQGIWWWLVVGSVLLMLLLSLIPQLKWTRRNKTKSRPRYGQVEDLALWFGRAQGGTYFKWMIANRLGRLAYQLLLHRESGRPRSVFAPLAGADWKPSPELQRYLEVGLHGSFSDYPNSGFPFSALPKTPLDHEIKDAVEFLESQLENTDLPRSH